MKQILSQYRNLIALVIVVILIVTLVASDPLGIVMKRKQEIAEIRNQIMIEEAEAEKKVAIIKAEQEAELIRIHQGLCEVTADDLIVIGTEGEN